MKGVCVKFLQKFFRKPAPPTAPALCFLRGDTVIAVLTTKGLQEVRAAGWFLGTCSFETTKGFWTFDLGMQTRVWRNGRHFAIGWNGCEEHIGTHIQLMPGDVLKYDRLGVGFFANADPPEKHPDIIVAIAA